MQEVTPQSFGKIRSFLWPIHGYEHKKLLPMFALFFLISFVYNVLRCMKVTLVVTAAGSGAEVIPFLKVWAVLPGAILLTFLYTELARRFNREQVFYAILGIFLGFFTLFMLVLHPNREALELASFTEMLQNQLPPWLKGLHGFFAIIRHWHLSLFYVLSELWSAVVLSMLFWGFANEVTSVNEAKRFYAIFALGANSSGIFSGQCAQFLTLKQYNPNLPFGTNAWEQSLFLQISAVLFLGLLIIWLYRWVNRNIAMSAISNNFSSSSIKSASSYNATVQSQTVKSTKKAEKNDMKDLSLIECFSYLIKSPYMLYIAILVVAYNIVYNLADVLWTEQVRQLKPNAEEFNSYINHIASLTGVFATISALLLSGNVIRKYGWTVTAMITPIIWLLTSVGFLGCLLFANVSSFTDVMSALCGIPVVQLALFFGSAQICLGRAAKYTVFDESKEIAFIPLPKEAQRKGKAVVDGIASRLGKSGGSLMIQVLLIVCGELMLTIPYVAGIFVIFMAGWIIAVKGLGKLASKEIDRELHSSEKASGVKGTVQNANDPILSEPTP